MTTANGTAEITANTQTNNRNADDNSGNVVTTDITSQMESAYLDYAMSVIVSRALPDVRDGLKPVHRRILYAMFSDLHLTSDKPHKKSARIVGEVLGKYHPHGDQAVYDAMVRMAQEFSLRYPLIDGQGNFGSIDGDGAAAMRYTEARLDAISNLMLDDLAKDTVDWHDNFDNSLQEPDILPAALPNLLINGSNGIAVGMATNIPPHNLSEVVDALAYMIDNFKNVDEITVEELMQFIKGPDFPTGGILYRYREGKADEDATDAIAQGYAVGRSRLVLQAKAHFEEMSRNRSRIVVTELPYQTNKTALIERIATLVRDGKIEGITDLRDESDRTGMRIVIEMTRNVDAKRILERLFKLTPLQQTFGLQMLALVDGEPITLGLRRMLQLFIQHRQEVVRRRTEFDLARAKERAHIVEGLLRALDILDEVIATIRASQRVDTARDNLVKKFKFTVMQAQAILDMQLRRLAALERRKLQDEYKELTKRIKYLEGLLASPKKMLEVIKNELLEIKEKYGDLRKTQLVERTKGTLTSTDLLPDQEVWVSVSTSGDLRRQAATKPAQTEARQVGKNAGLAILNGNTKNPLYLFGKDGQCRQVSIHEIPQSGGGKHASMYTDFTRRDSITAVCTLPRDPGEEGYLFLVTEQGMVKRVTIADFAKAAPLDPIVMGVDPKDRLGWVFRTTGDQEIILVASSGHSIRFSEADVRSMGLAAGGVGGMKIKKGHRLVYAGVVDPDGEVMTITEKGYSKRTAMKDYSKQGRNGGGITTHKPSARTGDVSAALVIDAASVTEPTEAQLVAVTDQGVGKPLSVFDVPQMGRGVQGKVAVALDMGHTIAAIHPVKAPEMPSPNGNGSPNGTNGHGSASASGNGTAKSSAKGKTIAASISSGATARRKTTTQARKSTTSGGRVSTSKATQKDSTTRAQAANGSTAKKSASTQAKATKSRPAKSGSAKSPAAKGGATRGTVARRTATTSKATAPKPATAKAANGKTNARKSTNATKSRAGVAKSTNARATTPKATKGTTTKASRTTSRASASKTTSTRTASAKPTGTRATGQRASSTKANATTSKAATGKSASRKTATSDRAKSKASTSSSTRTQKVVNKPAAKPTRSTAKAKDTSPSKTKASTSKSGTQATARTAAKSTSRTTTSTTKAQSAKVTAPKPKVTKPKQSSAKSGAKAAKPKSTAKSTKPAAAKPKSKRSAKLAAVTSVTRSQAKESKKKKAKK